MIIIIFWVVMEHRLVFGTKSCPKIFDTLNGCLIMFYLFFSLETVKKGIRNIYKHLLVIFVVIIKIYIKMSLSSNKFRVSSESERFLLLFLIHACQDRVRGLPLTHLS